MEQATTGTRVRRPWRRRAAAVAILAVVLLLVAVMTGQVFRMIHANDARGLVEKVAGERAAVLAMADEVRGPLAGLGDPARSWSQVECWTVPRYSDGDGARVVMRYQQECMAAAYDVYPLAPDAGGPADVARRLGGKIADGELTCDETLFDVLTPDVGANRPSEYGTALWWVEPGGGPSADGSDSCRLPEPGDPRTARAEITADGPLSADAYVVFVTMSPISAVDVGCDRRLPWLVLCAGEPEGFPVL